MPIAQFIIFYFRHFIDCPIYVNDKIDVFNLLSAAVDHPISIGGVCVYCSIHKHMHAYVI